MSDWFKNLVEAVGTLKPTLSTPLIKDIPTEKVSKPGAASYGNVPNTWYWLLNIEGLPKIVAAGLHEYGTLEGTGTLNNPKVINWADEVAKCHPTNYTNWAADWYNKDSIPWCGLFVALLACRSANGKKERMPVASYLTALSWASWGKTVDWKGKMNNVWCGDIAVFIRDGGGHVSVIVGVSKDGKYVACMGGNQGDRVDIKLFSTERLYAVRRPNYTVAPRGARHIRITGSGVLISSNEA